MAICFFNINEAVSSFRDCGPPYGLCDSLRTLQPFRSALTSPPDGCNTRYEWLASPYSTGTFTQPETPSFAWRTSEILIVGDNDKNHQLRRSEMFRQTDQAQER